MARCRATPWMWCAAVALAGCGDAPVEPAAPALDPAPAAPAAVPAPVAPAVPPPPRAEVVPMVDDPAQADPLAGLDVPTLYPARTVALAVEATSWRDEGPMDVRAALVEQLAAVNISVVEAPGPDGARVAIAHTETEGSKMQVRGGFAEGDVGVATDIAIGCEIRLGNSDEPIAATAVSVEPRAGELVEERGDLEASLARHARERLRAAPGFLNLGLFVAAALGDREALRRLLVQRAGGDPDVALDELLERPAFAPADPIDRALVALWRDDLPACAAAGPEGRALLVRELAAQDLSGDSLGYGETEPVVEAGRRLAAVAGALATVPDPAASRALAAVLARLDRPDPEGVPRYVGGGEDPADLPEVGEAWDAGVVVLLQALARIGSPFDLAAAAPLRDDPVPAVAAAAAAAVRSIGGRLQPSASDQAPPTVRVQVRATAADPRRFDVGAAVTAQCRAAGLAAPRPVDAAASCVVVLDYFERTPPPGGGPPGIGVVVCVTGPGTEQVVGPFVVSLPALGSQADAIAALRADPLFQAIGRFVAAAAGDRAAQEALWPHVFEWDLTQALPRCAGAAEPTTPAGAAWWRLARGDVAGCVALGPPARDAFLAYAPWAASRPAAAARIAEEARLAKALAEPEALPLLHARLAVLPSLNELDAHVFHSGDSDAEADAAALAAVLDALAALTPPADRPALVGALRHYVIDERESVATAARAACTALAADLAAIERELRKEIDERDNPPDDGMGEGEGGGDDDGG